MTVASVSVDVLNNEVSVSNLVIFLRLAEDYDVFSGCFSCRLNVNIDIFEALIRSQTIDL